MSGLICPKCSGEMDAGSVRSEISLLYTSNSQKGMLKLGTPVDAAHVCITCGYLELYINPVVLQKKIRP